MLLTIDIGNTSTKFGIYDNAAFVARRTIPTIFPQNANEIYHLAGIKQKIRHVIISSVVAELESTYRIFAKKYYDVEPVFVTSSINANLKVNYVPAETLGVDRFVAALMATEKYGAPCIVCDFGTATTIDAVNSQREFLGGIIAPGMDTMREALFTNTAALPLIKLRRPEKIIGNSTVASIQSGIYNGYIALVDGLIEKMKAELKEQPKVVATGGLARLICEASQQIETLDDNLMLDGLWLIYEKYHR